MALMVYRLLEIHGFAYNDVTITSINEDGTINIVDKDGVEYKIDGAEMVMVKDKLSNIWRPRGWSLKKVFVDNDGNVFHKGVEQPELKGTIKIPEE